MIDIKKIREDFDATAEQLARRGVEQEKVARARDLDAKRRALIGETETLKQQRNSASKEIVKRIIITKFLFDNRDRRVANTAAD